ncbi:Rtr1/RPAP2 family protein phosphatase [Rhodotorula paludigena]|uniref:Rtr1/RPAP2 family protein phosphatase n=1 Tax=Rhodotorula paludigena TaxID=86838 RepID=UPI003177413E
MPSLTPASKPPRNPSAFHVATSSTPRSPAQDASVLSSFAHSAATRYLSHAPSPSSSSSSSSAPPDPRSLAHQLDLIESLSSPSGVPPPELKRLAGALSRSSYADLLEERHAAGRCAYPGCGHPARQAYVAPGERQREPRTLRVRMRANGLFDARRSGEGEGEGDEAGRFCGARCAARSAFLEGQVGRAGRGAAAAVELLEDVEGRREGVRRSTQELLAAQAASAGAAEKSNVQDEEKDKGKGKERFREDLLSSLTIHEKPTPSAPPAAPSLANPAPDFERRAADVQAQAQGTTRFPRAPAPRDGGPGAGGGGGAALLPFETARLARTVLSTLPAPPPPPPPPRASRQPGTGTASGLPPITFVTGPRMVDERTGALVEWAGVGADGEDEGVSDEVRAWIEEGIRERDSARGRGEIE